MRLIEIFLAQIIIYFGLWLWNDYVASLITLIFTSIIFAVLLVAFISEKMERSKVGKRFFQIMLLSVLAPIFAALIYFGFVGGGLSWLG